MFTFKGLLVKKLSALLAGLRRRYLPTQHALTRLSREWVFSAEFNTPAKRRRATRRAICSRAAVLQQPWQSLLVSAYAASRLPAASNEAYRLKLLLDSVMPTSSNDSWFKQNPAGEYSPLQQAVLTVILRIHQCNTQQLQASLQSLRAQNCPNWEVWLVVSNADAIDDLSSALVDPRIYYAVDEQRVLQQSAGLLMHELQVGDSLHAEAVGELSRYLADNEDICLIYTDHDHLDANSERCQPVFKPDWSPDLFAAYDYIGPAVFLRPECLKRADAVLDECQAVHIPKVLYHCAESDAVTSSSQNVDDSWLAKYLAKLSLHAQAIGATPSRGLIPHSTRWHYSLPKFLPKVSLIIPTRDGLDVLKPCVESILCKTSYLNYEIIIIDNQSTDPKALCWLDEQAEDKRIQVLRYDYPFNYSAMNNFAALHAAGGIIGLLNNDVEVINSDWLDEMVMHAWRPEIGCVGAKLYYGDGRIQHAGVILGANGGTAHGHRYFDRDADGYCGRLKLVQNVSAVTGACLLLRRDLFEQVGGLEEKYLQIACNDIDLCLKVREAGYRNLWTPYAELYHHESVSRGRDISSKQRKRYQAEKAWMEQRWGELLWCDPYYNPNLTAAREDFSLNMLYGL